MSKLPEAYIIQMKRLLGEAGFFAYEKSLSDPVTRALRVNLLLSPDGSLPCEVEGVAAPVPDDTPVEAAQASEEDWDF